MRSDSGLNAADGTAPGPLVVANHDAHQRSAIRFHLETFGEEALGPDDTVLEAFLDEAVVA